MKRLKYFVATIVVVLFCIAWTPPSGNVTLEWDYPPNEMSTNLTFYVYTTTNIATPLTNWLHLTNTVGTNLSVRFRIVPGQQWFVMTASNVWGESDFSEVVSTPPLPRRDQKLQIKRQD